MYDEDYKYYGEKHRKNKNISAVTLTLCVCVSSIFGFAGGYASNKLYTVQGVETEYQGESKNLPVAEAAAATKSFAEVAADVKLSVVEITTEVIKTNRMIGQYILPGAGSGVVVSADGYIVTNHHVVEDAANLTVRLSNGTEYPAALIGSDPQSDLAVIKIDAAGLTPATFGDSSNLVVGETTIAVGNPLGELGGTVTSGIISALDREINFGDQTMTLLQTDAAINPGNSGGGLFNSKGELIGIVNSKSSGMDIEGLGFAIPVNTAKTVISDIIDGGYVKGRIDTGLTVVDIADAQTARMYRVNYIGLYISKSVNSQFVSGDRILYIDGKEVKGQSDYNSILSNYSIGDTIQVTVSRGYETLTIPLTLGELRG